MKTAEEKAREYADSVLPIFVPETVIENTIADLNKFALIDYLTGYYEAMSWINPKDEFPKEGEEVLCKMESIILTGFHSNGIFYSNETSEILEKVIGWRPIE